MWESILLVLLVALAIVGLWHLAALTCGYKVLPMYQRSACGSQVHQLAYITEHERHQLMAAGGSGKAQPGTQGVPCYPSTPPPSPSAKRPKRSDETPSIHLGVGGFDKETETNDGRVMRGFGSSIDDPDCPPDQMKCLPNSELAGQCGPWADPRCNPLPPGMGL